MSAKKSGNMKLARRTRPSPPVPDLLTEVRELVLAARQTVARGVNAALVMLYWKIGERIRRDVLHEKRADYGEEVFSTLSRELGWSHFVELIPLKKPLQRAYLSAGLM